MLLYVKYGTAHAVQVEEKVSRAVSEARRDWKVRERKHREASELRIKELSKMVVDVESKVEHDNFTLKQVELCKNACTALYFCVFLNFLAEKLP